jgi:hypothetical protein
MGTTRSTGSILAIAGGIGLAVAAFLSWGTVSLDAAKFATALGIDPSQITPGSLPQMSQSVSGTDGWEGKLAVVAGVVAIVIGVIAMREVRKGLGVVLIVAGLVGGGVALYDVVTVNDQKEAAIEDASSDLQQFGIQASTLSDAIDVSLDAGIWICVLAGLVVVVAGVMVRAGENERSTGTSLAGFGTTFGSPTPMTPVSPPGAMAPPAPAAPLDPLPPQAGIEAPPAEDGPGAPV